MSVRDPDERPSRVRDLLVAGLGMLIVLALEVIACALAPAQRRPVPPAPCVLDAQKVRL